MTDHVKEQLPEQSDTFTVELTAKELSATIEAFNVADSVVDGRPPLKTGSPVQTFVGGAQFRHVNGAGNTAWKKFIRAEGSRS